MGIANIDCEVITMGTLATWLAIFSIFCVVIVLCMCKSSTNWRNESHDYEYEEIVRRNKEKEESKER